VSAPSSDADLECEADVDRESVADVDDADLECTCATSGCGREFVVTSLSGAGAGSRE
jgi:hypothetical protein